MTAYNFFGFFGGVLLVFVTVFLLVMLAVFIKIAWELFQS